MSMNDLKTLIDRIEARRKKREYVQMAVGVLLAVLVLGGAGYFAMTAVTGDTSAVVAVAPKPTAFDSVHVTAKAAIVYDLTTGTVLYAKNAEAQLPLASLTKLLTLYAASESLSAKSPVVITHKATTVESGSGLREGDTFTFEDAARLAIVASSNEAAAAIAEAAAKASESPNGTALLANAASSIGLTQTYALNGTELDENGAISGGYGSANDIEVLAGALLYLIPEIIHGTRPAKHSATSWHRIP